MTDWPVHARIDGPIVMIGFGSIGKGTLPLIERHFAFDKSRLVVIDPEDNDRHLLDERGIRFIHQAVTRDNYRELLTPLLTAGGGRGFCVNLSVDTSSLDIMELCREIGALYIDTVVEPWPGFYFDPKLGPEARSNYALRETCWRRAASEPGGTTAVSCCGANPGMVSWFVKQALLDIAARHRAQVRGAEDARGMGAGSRMKARRQGHPHRRARHPARQAAQAARTSSSTPGRSKASCRRACSRPSSAGARTRNGCRTTRRKHKTGCGAAIYLLQPGANTRVRSWTPTAQAQYGFLVTHNESISIADYFTLREGGKVVYRPTCHYAYHPCNDAVLSLHELFGRAGERQDDDPHPRRARDRRRHRRARRAALRPRKNAYWYGSQLSIEETRGARALPERDRPAGHLGGARRHGVGAGESERRHRRGRRDGLPPLPRSAAALSRPGDRRLHRLDAAHRTARPVPGGHRHERSLAVQERAGRARAARDARKRQRAAEWPPVLFCADKERYFGSSGGFSPGCGGGFFCCCGGGCAGFGGGGAGARAAGGGGGMDARREAAVAALAAVAVVAVAAPVAVAVVVAAVAARWRPVMAAVAAPAAVAAVAVAAAAAPVAGSAAQCSAVAAANRRPDRPAHLRRDVPRDAALLSCWRSRRRRRCGRGRSRRW